MDVFDRLGGKCFLAFIAVGELVAEPLHLHWSECGELDAADIGKDILFCFPLVVNLGDGAKIDTVSGTLFLHPLCHRVAFGGAIVDYFQRGGQLLSTLFLGTSIHTSPLGLS